MQAPADAQDNGGERVGAREERARRLLNLFFILNTTPTPLTTGQIIDDTDLGYGSPERGSDLKKFKRDREDLEHLGVYITEVLSPGDSQNEESRWTVDRKRTFAAGGIITRDDAELLLDAIAEYLSGPATPLEAPLASILGTLSCAVDPTKAPQIGAAPADPRADAVWTAFSLGRALVFLYTNSHGETRKRTVEIYGIFTHEGASYFAGRDTATDSIKTFRVDRIERVWAPRGAYTIPASFDVHDYLFFSFEMERGTVTATDAVFFLPGYVSEGEISAITYGRGELSALEDGGWRWTIPVKSERAAAAFALRHARDGMRPVAPRALIDEWSNLVKGATARYGC